MQLYIDDDDDDDDDDDFHYDFGTSKDKQRKENKMQIYRNIRIFRYKARGFEVFKS